MQNYEVNGKNKITFRLDGCLWIIILSAVAGIAVSECSRAQLRLEKDKLELKNIKNGIKISDVNTFNIAMGQKQR
ncbi:MAG: hypothetical protein MJ187_00470 [Alphaproteobacteria bacterium]|nr:hypothetical protein [Alphaproteobacteria bacterium]